MYFFLFLAVYILLVLAILSCFSAPPAGVTAHQEIFHRSEASSPRLIQAGQLPCPHPSPSEPQAALSESKAGWRRSCRLGLAWTRMEQLRFGPAGQVQVCSAVARRRCAISLVCSGQRRDRGALETGSAPAVLVYRRVFRFPPSTDAQPQSCEGEQGRASITSEEERGAGNVPPHPPNHPVVALSVLLRQLQQLQ